MYKIQLKLNNCLIYSHQNGCLQYALYLQFGSKLHVRKDSMFIK